MQFEPASVSCWEGRQTVVDVHLTGMGLLGSLTAWQLKAHGLSFTWNDNDSPVTAWKACTGACYPASGKVDQRSYTQWQEWAQSEIYPPHCLEECGYWVDSAHKSLPHGLEADVIDQLGPLRLVGTSVHVNAQALVDQTRERFAAQRTVRPCNAKFRVVSHGFSKRLGHYLWGWTRLIRLKYNGQIEAHGRPSFYLRKNRFQFAYCYPQPGTDWWYAGSNLISQRQAKPLEVQPKYAAWKQRFAELSGGAVEIVEEGPIIEGWRPAKAGSLSQLEGHKAAIEPLLLVEGSRIYYPTLASNGFRHFPEVWRELWALLNEQSP